MSLDPRQLADRIARLAPDKRSAFLQALAAQGLAFSRLPIVPAPREGFVPLSFAQQRLWFLAQLEPDSAAYHMPVALRLRGTLDAAALQRSFSFVVARHDVLRTTFHARPDGQPEQRVHASLDVMLHTMALHHLPPAEREARLVAAAEAEARRAFDLERGPVLRASLIGLAADEHVLLVTLHHIAGDAVSLGVLTRELAAAYGAFVQRQAASLPSLPIQYADFAIWQRQWLDDHGDPQARAQLDHWARTLGDEHPVLDLPADRARPKAAGDRGARHRIAIEQADADALRRLSRRHGATLFMTLLAAFDVLLYRLSGQTDLRVGVPVANRHRAELHGLIGCFVNTQVLRVQLHGALPFDELLARVKSAALDAQEHQDLPFERLVEALQPQRDTSRTPLFQVMFNLVEAVPALQLPGLAVEALPQHAGGAQFDLTLDVIERETALDAVFSYRCDLFDAATVERFAGAYARILQAVVQQPDTPLACLPILCDDERRQLTQRWSGAQVPCPHGEPVHQGFERQVRATPDAVALVLDDAQLSYAQLNKRANRLAHRLIAAGAGPEVLVGICVERSIDMVVALLAVLKAGAAYVPLDPAYPAERLAYMVDSAGIRLLLTQASLADRLPANGLEVIDLAAPGSEPAYDPARPTQPQQAAYVMFTSGSTGRPKGVCISHAALARHARVTLDFLGLRAADRVLQFSTFSFDGFVEQLYPALLCGATVVLRGPDVWDGEELYRRIHRHRISVADLTTAYWAQVVQDFARAGPREVGPLRVVSVTGEAMPPEGVAAWRAAGLAHVRLLNTYGPTEATVTAMLYDCAPHVAGSAPLPAQMPVGRGLAGRSIVLLDRDGEPVPAGVPGELCIGGPLLARGYHERPALTAERFVPDPFGAPGARLYRTGDLARWRADGVVEYLGRIDQQVKLRGFRIELGEIEARLLAHPAVEQALVLVREDRPGDKRLAAYLVAHGPRPADDALRSHLRQALPDYMLPAGIVWLEAFPLGRNGKLDRAALPAPEFTSEDVVAPRTPQEATLARLWCEVLGVAQLGVHDNFFDLGGHSLLATQLVSRIRRELGCELAVRALFEAPTVAQLAARLAGQARAVEPAIPPLPRDGAKPQVFALSHAQERLWFLHRLEPESAAYHVPAAVRLVGTLDAAALQAAFDALVMRHEALRTTFREHDGHPVQRVEPRMPVPLPVHDLRPLDPAARAAQAQALVAQQAALPFDLAQGPLIRLALLRLADDEHLLAATMHHIVCDGWSMGVLVRELTALYAARVQARDAALPLMPLQYADFAAWQRERLSGAELERQTAYWTRMLAGQSGGLELPTDRPRPAVPTGRGGKHRFVIDAAPLRSLARAHGATLFMVLLAAFDAWLYARTGRADPVVGTDIANRNRAETEHIVGFFVNQLALRADLSGNPSFTELLARTRERVLDAYGHQDLPFNKLVAALNPVRRLAQAPVFQVKLVLQNQDEAPLALPGLEVLPEAIDHGQVQLDLLIAITETPAGLNAVLEYSADLFDAPTAAAFAEQIAAVLARAAAEPGVALDVLAQDVFDHARRARGARDDMRSAEALQRLRGTRRRAITSLASLEDVQP